MCGPLATVARKQGLTCVLDPANQSSNSKFLGVGEGPESREAGGGECFFPPTGDVCQPPDNASWLRGFADPWEDLRASVPTPTASRGARTSLVTVGTIKHFEQRCAFVIR